MRYSPAGSLVSDGRALRQLESEAFAEKWFGTFEGQIASINAFFVEVEIEFINARRDAALNPDRWPLPAELYDTRLLHLRRCDMARKLIDRGAKRELHKYIWRRAKLPLELPALPVSERSEAAV